MTMQQVGSDKGAVGIAVLVDDEWVPVSAEPVHFEWSDADEPEPDETVYSLGRQSWRMTVEIAESEPVIWLIRRLEREQRQRRMLARWWLRFPFREIGRCSLGSYVLARVR
ncbi:MAG: hypothetical protein FJW64_04020 [Actinobacteria bacterium]|nr:hypothetical protein [Actinomycetota bacterium]